MQSVAGNHISTFVHISTWWINQKANFVRNNPLTTLDVMQKVKGV